MPAETGREYVPPTDEQLVNFACVYMLGAGYSAGERETVAGILAIPKFREMWLARHRQMQETAWGLQDAI